MFHLLCGFAAALSTVVAQERHALGLLLSGAVVARANELARGSSPCARGFRRNRRRAATGVPDGNNDDGRSGSRVADETRWR